MFKPPTNRSERGAPLGVPPQGEHLTRTRSFLGENLNLDEDVKKIQPVRVAIEYENVVLVPAIAADFELTWYTGLSNKSSATLEGAGIRKHNVDTIYSPLPGGISARVLQYEYNHIANQKDLKEYASDLLQHVRSKRQKPGDETRPLHFGAHSTGGLVVKQALLMAQQEPVYRHIFTSCFGVSFFGTPHRGSTILSDASFANGIKQELHLAHILPSNIMRLLKPDSRELWQLNEDFKTKSRKLKRVWTFVEADESTLEVRSPHTAIRGSSIGQMRAFVVDNRSSELHIGNETIFEIGSNHRNLCKFTGVRNSGVLGKYKRELVAVVQELMGDDYQLHHSLPAEVHLFYQNELGSADHNSTPRVKLLTAKSNFNTLIDKGPKACLKERIAENVINAPPQAFTDDTLIAGAESHFSAPQIQVHEADEDDDETRHTGSDDRSTGLALPITVTLSEDDSDLTLQRRSTTASISTSVRSLDDPALQNKYFSWIHVPCNHPSWALDVLDRIIGDQKDEERNPNERLLNEHVLHSSHNLSHYGLAHSRRMRSQFKWLGSEPKPKNARGKSDPHASLVVYLPYLHWDTIDSMKFRSALTKEKKKHNPKGKIPRWIDQLNSMEHQLLWQNPNGHGNLHIHQRRSLDQFGYPSLTDTTARDHDQVLYKRTKKLRQEARDRPFKQSNSEEDSIGNSSEIDEYLKPQTMIRSRDNGKVLMVDQLWLFVTDRENVVTFFSPKEASGDEDASRNTGDLRNSIYNDVNGDPVFATQCHTPLEFAALTVLHAVTVLLDRVTDEELQVFDIFESYLSHLTEEQTESFKRFRWKQERRAHRRIANLTNASLEDEDNAEEQEEEKDTRDNIQDLQNLTELRDIEDELSTIGRLLDEQSEVVSSMHRNATQSLSPDFGDQTQRLLKEAREAIQRYQKRVQGLKNQCKSAQSAYEFLLDMRDKQANIFEARRMRKSARVAEEQNRSIISFTIFTIIFLPLSFFTSLFGINAKEWSGNGANPALHQIFVLTFAISAAVIVVALLLAFNKVIRKYSYRFFGTPYRFLQERIEHLKPARQDRRIESALRPMFAPEEGLLWQLEPAKHAGIEKLTKRKTATANAREVALDA